MRTKLLMFLLLCLASLQLTGCTSTADRIYTICKVDETGTYCYKDANNFYKISNEGKLLKISGVNLKARPALRLLSNSTNYCFENVLPGLYKGTLHSVSAYINKLQAEGYTCDIIYTDPNDIELLLSNDVIDLRLVYNTYGEVRLYARDNSSNPIEPPYINEE